MYLSGGFGGSCTNCNVVEDGICGQTRACLECYCTGGDVVQASIDLSKCALHPTQNQHVDPDLTDSVLSNYGGVLSCYGYNGV